MLNIGLLSFFDEDEGGKYTIASLRIAASLLDMDNVSVEIIPIPINTVSYTHLTLPTNSRV